MRFVLEISILSLFVLIFLSIFGVEALEWLALECPVVPDSFFVSLMAELENSYSEAH
jgi:hypothetical protein